MESTEMTQDQLLNYQLMFPIGQDKSIPWNAITAYENMKAKRISEFKKWKEQVGFLCKPFKPLQTISVDAVDSEHEMKMCVKF